MIIGWNETPQECLEVERSLRHALLESDGALSWEGGLVAKQSMLNYGKFCAK
jgi:hypothetical protein